MRPSPRMIAAVVTALLGACVARPTKVTTDWKDPAPRAMRFQKVAAFFPQEDPKLRRQVEDRLAGRLPNTVASYTFIPDERLAAVDTQAIQSALSDAGFDGVLVLRLVNVESQSAGIPTASETTPGEDLAAYLRRTPRAALKPGQQTVITMESRAYSVPGGKLVWVGHSRSFNPVSLGELVNMVVDASVAEVRRQGLL
jgi:hypothetical protein